MSETAVLDRTKFIGGSDAPAVLGLSRWRTPLMVWAEKTGTIPREQVETIPMKVGKALEPTVCALFMEETGIKLMPVSEQFYHKDHPILAAQIDSVCIDEDAFFEAKTCSIRKAKEWEGDDEIPAEYIIQVMHDLAVTGKAYAYIGVLIGNEDFKWRKVERDEKLIAEMISREVAFWNTYVIPKAMPDIITAKDSQTLYKLYPLQEAGTQIELGDEGARLIEMRNALHTDNINLETQIDKIENEIKAMLKEAEAGIAGAWRVTWKQQTRKAHQVKESTFRAFRVSQLKGGHNGNE